MTRRRESHRARRVRISGIGAVIVIAAAVYIAFVKSSPFSHDYVVNAIFSNATQLKPGSPVRVSGIDVGTVTAINPAPGHAARVTMHLDQPAAVRATATMAIRPRLLFEGNFYVDASPGRPGDPQLPRNATVSRARTSVPVQLDQVLNTLDRPARTALQQTISGLGRALSGTPSGAAAIKDAIAELDAALGDVTRVAAAAQGTRPGDARRMIQGLAGVSEQLAADPNATAGLVTNINRSFRTIAEHDGELSATVRQFAQLGRSGPPDLDAINDALPPLRRFALQLRPTLDRAPSALSATNKLLGALDRITQPSRLPLLLRRTAPIAATLPALERQLTQTFSYVTPVAQCVDRTLVPAVSRTIPDGAHSTHDPAWLDFLHLGASLAAGSPSFDGNGTTIRLGVTQGAQSATGILGPLGPVAASADFSGVRPHWLGYGALPPSRPDARCKDQPLPNFASRTDNPTSTGVRSTNLPAARPTAVQTLIRRIAFTTPGASRNALIDRLIDLLGLKPPARKPRPQRKDTRPVAPHTSKIPSPAVPPLTDVPSAVQKLIEGLLGLPASNAPNAVPGTVEKLLDTLTGQGSRR